MTDTGTAVPAKAQLAFGELLRKDRQNRAPDVLNTIANLSSDEVFTPPEFANKMLDTLADAWAADHHGESIWADPNVTFLDPATKSGAFLREIAKRLVEGQGNPPEGSDERRALLDRVLTKQVYGIGMTTITALMSRRSIYCSKDATSEHSVAPSSTSRDGNIWFERTEHTWAGDRCAYCPASKAGYERGEESETHAYALIHHTNPKALIAQLFGEDMHFDVIVGNPPYQLNDGGGEDGASAAPIYQKFVQAAKSLEPRYLTMVTPSRWFAGGKGLDEYRAEMLADSRLRTIVDYANEKEVFPAGVNVRGGVSYFLWDSSYDGLTEVLTVRNGETVSASRDLGEFDVFVRDARSVEILHKVLAVGEKSIAERMSNRNPFDLGSTVSGDTGDIDLYFIEKRKRGIGRIKRSSVKKNPALIDSWKVLAPKAGLAGDAFPDSVLTKPWIAPPPSVCTESFLVIIAASSTESESIRSYYSTKFFRFLVSLRKISQNTTSSTYLWVPEQSWDRTWTDEALYQKYQLTSQEVEYIESGIKAMDVGSVVSDEVE